MRRRRRPIEELRSAIECLPVHTRTAMLEGVGRWPIIVGAYTDRRGGVCPMLAAHRCGGRTDFLAFARAWDRFTHAKRPRRATDREVATLVAYVEASLASAADDDFERAIAEHQAAGRRRRADEAARVGWTWLWSGERRDEAGPQPDEREREPA